MTKTLRILCDVDNVIADFDTAYLKVAEQLVGRQSGERTDWDYVKGLGLTEEEGALIDAVLESEGFARGLTPIEGAVEAVKELGERYDLYFVTKPLVTSPTWSHERMLWLRQHFGELGEKVVLTSHKELVHGNILIDDNLTHLDSWSEKMAALQVPHTPICWSYPHNRETHWARTNSWREVGATCKTLQAVIA